MPQKGETIVATVSDNKTSGLLVNDDTALAEAQSHGLKIGYLDVEIRNGIMCHVIRMVPLDYCSYCGHLHPYKFRQHVRACEKTPLCPESEWQNQRDFLNGTGPYSEWKRRK